MNIISISVVTKLQTRAVEKSLINENILLAQLVSGNIESGYFTQQWPFEILKEIADAPNVIYWRIIKPDGEVYLANDAEMWGKNISDRNTSTEKMLVLDTIFKKTGERIKIIVNPLKKIRERGKPWTFWLGFSLKPIIVAKRRIVFANLGLGIVIVAFTGLLSFYLAKSITRPVKNLVEGTKAISNGNLNYQIEIKTSDEIGELAASFNQMTQDLKKSKDEREKLIDDLEVSRDEIEKYSQELERKAEELSRTIAKLTDFRDATIYMLSDLDKTTKVLEEAKNYTDSIIKSMIDTLIVVDPDGKIKTINRATEELLGYKEDELIGQPVGMMFEEEEEEEEESLFKGTRLEKLLKEGSVKDYDMTYLTKGKERIPVGFSGSVMRDKNGNLVGIVGVARDMREIKRLMQKEKELAASEAAAETEKKRASELNKAYKELRETQAKLIQAGRLAALGTLGAGIAHQLNQPLTGIRLFAQIMETQIDKNNPLRKDLDQIIEQTKYMADIIENIQGFARASKVKRKPIEINEPIEKSLQLVSEQLKAHKIVLLKNLDPDLPKVNAAANQMQQIFLNFITNAREAMDSMPEEATKNLRITTRPKTKNNFVEIIFQDTGPGIPEDIKDRIFDPFFTTKGPSSTGLGLSLSHGIIRDHSGTIEVDSRQGKGTTFIVRLPAHVK